MQPIPVDSQPIPDPSPIAHSGPYEQARNGTCAQGHPVNGFGRCQPLNEGLEGTPGPVSPVQASHG